MAQGKNTSNKTTSNSTKSSSAPRKKSGTASATKAQMAVRRQIWGAGYILVGFLLSLAVIGAKGSLLSVFKNFIMGLIGTGFYILPVSFVVSGLMMIIKKRGKVRLRVCAIMCVPVIVGMLSHVFSAGGAMPYSDAIKFYTMGGLGTSGGVVSGLIASLIIALISVPGAVVVIILILFATFIVGFNINPIALFSKIRWEAEEHEEKKVLPKAPVETRGMFRRKKQAIDIPLDGGEHKMNVNSSTGEAYFAPPNVKSPADVLNEQKNRTDPAPARMDDYAFPPTLRDGLVTEDTEEKTVSLTFTPSAEPSSEVKTPPAAKWEKPIAVEKPTAEPKKEDFVEITQKISQEIDEMLRLHKEDEQSYMYPPISILKQSVPVVGDHGSEVKQLTDRLVDNLLSFGIDSKVVSVTRGPTVTRYELRLQRGVKFSRVQGLSDDIALSLGAASVRISTIPDKQAVGIEVPNRLQQVVTLRDILESREFTEHSSKICFPVGRDITNSNIVGDITKMPHMLIAGTTGSGKSVCINSIIISLIYKSSPEEVRLIMIDPKMIELGIYNGIPHLLIPVVTDPKKASGALNWAVSEMMRRYKLLSELGVRDLAGYNDEIEKRGDGEKLPQIVIVIDELADLMFVAANEVEEAIARIAQMARAAGMHLIIATQRPSADIITGIMKANIPSRIAFAVASQIESRIILDTMGAEKLIGRGDMLYAPLGAPKPMRVQGCFITTSEVEEVVSFVKKTSSPDYKNEIMEHIELAAENTGKRGGGGNTGINATGDDEDSMMQSAIEVVVETGQASVSMLQRRLKLGYSRAARLVDQMEERGIVGPFEGSKPRQVLITRSEWQEMVLRQKDV